MYYPEEPGRRRKGGIFTGTGRRGDMTIKELTTRPSPGDYDISGDLSAKKAEDLAPGVGFPKSSRPELNPPPFPPPGTYDIASKLGSTHGKMGWKLLRLVKNITPSVHDYCPNTALTERKERESLTLIANRTDFSRSMTGRIGPGAYNLSARLGRELGKIGTSQRPPIRSETVLFILFSPGQDSTSFPPLLGESPNITKIYKEKYQSTDTRRL